MSQATNEIATEPAYFNVGDATSPFKTLLKGSAVYGLGTILVQAINILLMPILTGHLSAAEFGAIALLNFLGLIASGIFSLGANSSLAICYFDREETSWRDSVISTAFVLMAISAFVLSFATYEALPWLASCLLGNESFSTSTLYAAVASGATLLIIPFDNRLRLDNRLVKFIAASFLSTATISGLTLWFVIGFARGIEGYFEALLIGRIISFLSFYCIAGGIPTRQLSAIVAHKLLRIGLPIMPQFILLYFLQYGNIDLLKRLNGLDQAGIFSAGLTIGLSSNIVISSISNSWAPFFLSFSNRQQEAREIFGRITKYYVLGVGLFSLLFYYFSKVLMMILASPEYFSGHQVVGPVATGMFMLGLSNMLLPPTYFAKDAGKITYVGLVAVLVQIVLGSSLIPFFGIIGAGWTFASSYITYTALIYLVNISSKRYFRIIYQWPALYLFGLAYALSCIVLSASPDVAGYSQIAFFIGHFMVMLVVAYLALDPAELKILKGSLRLLGYKI
jgi:O-antigen/teichoic acid export membrane protein